jgi:O-antigen/teichoic acid export membrane protein
LIGLQHQVRLSSLVAFFATLRGLGALLVLVFISNSVVAYFVWQVVVSTISVVIFSFSVKRLVPLPVKVPKFSKEILYKLKNFATSMMLISFLALLLNQVDKIILSKMISLEQFGYYTFAATIAAGLFQLVGPVTQAYYPMLTRMISSGQTQDLVKAYHYGAKIIAIGIFPIVLILVVFGEELIYLWTNDSLLAKNSFPILRLLAIGNGLNCLIQMPYMLQLANGSTKWALNVSIAAMLFSVPATIWAALTFGSIGAAWVWVLINIGHIFISMHFIKEKVFLKEKWRWYIFDLLLPTGLIAAIFFVFVTTYPFGVSRAIDLVGYASVFLVVEVILIGVFFRPAAAANLFRRLVKS